MYTFKSFIEFIEIGKDRTVSWSERFQDIFSGVFSTVAGLLMLIFGAVMTLIGYFESMDAYVYSGIIIAAGGFLAGAFYLMARRRKKYGRHASLLLCIGAAVCTLGVLFSGNHYMTAILIAVYSPVACLILNVRRGAILSLSVMAAYLALALLTGAGVLLLTASIIVALFMLLVTCGFLQFNGELVEKANSKIENITRETDEKTEFIAQLSHQIRTPLNNIVVMSNMLNETPLNLRQKDWMETIIASTNNLVSTVDIITSTVASAEIVDLKPATVVFTLNTLMNNTVQLFVGQSEDYNIGLKPNMEIQHPLEGNPIQIRQIFLTLIDAIISNRQMTKINIIISYSMKPATEQVYDAAFKIMVSDDIYFDPDRDFMEDPKRLNFSIASKLIAMTGGRLSVSRDSVFTVFDFTLPLKKAAKDAAPTAAKTSGVAEQYLDSLNLNDSLKVELKDAIILLVEDNLINQKIVILSIQKLVKSIEIANNGQEAVEKFNSSKHHVILMDIQMPVMDGIQATKKIREMEAENHLVPTPIIAITANALAGDREHCLASGMDEYISKPFQVEVLVTKMKNLLAIGSAIRT